MQVPRLVGRHAVLECLAPSHAEELWHAAQDPSVWRYMPTPGDTPDGLADWIAARRKGLVDGTALPFLIRDAATGQAVGSTSLFDVNAAHRSAEIGHTWLAGSARRTGINTEAKLLLMGHAFDTLGLLRVQLKTDERNLESQRAIERLGAVREGVLRWVMVLPDGHHRSVAMYSVIAPEWPAVKARLAGLLARRE